MLFTNINITAQPIIGFAIIELEYESSIEVYNNLYKHLDPDSIRTSESDLNESTRSEQLN